MKYNKMNTKKWISGLAVAYLLGGAMVLGDQLAPKQVPEAPVPPKDSKESHASLTPRQPATLKNPVVLAQKNSLVKRDGVGAPTPDLIDSTAVLPITQEPVTTQTTEIPAAPAKSLRPSPPKISTQPLLAANNPPVASDSAFCASNEVYFQSELDRLAAEIKSIKKDLPKKPDTKKGWGTPKVSGRIFLDSVNVADQDTDSLNQYGNMKNGAGFRELRIGVSGTGFDSFDYKIELGYTGKNGTVDLIDNWIGVKHVPLFGYVRAGHFKPETGLSYPMSTNDISMMEYITPVSAFGMGRRIGVSSENLFAKDRVRLFAGVFQDGETKQSRYLPEDNQGYVVNFRLSAAPIFENEGRRVLHFGGHWSFAGTEKGTTTVKVSPASFAFLDPTLTTGAFACDDYNRGGLEFAYQNGPFSLSSEMFVGCYNAFNTSPSRNLFGAYVELGWFLTGENRVYNLSKGSFGAPKVRRNFHPLQVGDCNLIDGFGAWQAICQWGYLDMSDWRDVSSKAGHQNDIVLGLNWFWTPNIKWMFEYVHSMQDLGMNHIHADEDIFGTSVRLYF